MNCRRVEELLSLYVENDLGESESRAVSLHLASCQSCGDLLGHYRDSQDWMKSHATAQFSDDFFDEIRRSVLADIEEKPRANWVQMIIDRLRPVPLMAATAALLVLIGGVALYMYLGKEGVDTQRETFAVRPQQPPGQNKENSATQTPVIPEEKEVTPKQHKPLPRPRRRDAAVAMKQKSEKILPQTGVELPGLISVIIGTGEKEDIEKLIEEITRFNERIEGMTRMEIQTRDPNIRIIWFAPKIDNSHASRPVTD